MSKLTNGCIPPHKQCPFAEQCPLFNGCYHKGLKHEVPFSCATARAFDLMERNNGLRDRMDSSR